MKQSINIWSEGTRMSADLFIPDGYKAEIGRAHV